MLVRKTTFRLALRNPTWAHSQGQGNGAPRFEMGERLFVGHLAGSVFFPSLEK
jgi:hypothetical protein